jgi:diguanylate cyclase (GGDEF)-like protein/PAS domain S-box-containing protein
MHQKSDELFDQLRLQAEALARTDGSESSARNGQAVEKLIHALQERQRGLMRRIDEMRKSQQDLENFRDRYIEYYVFAPAGYLSIGEDGRIHEANLTIAGLLGAERSALLGESFYKFLDENTQGSFEEHLQRARRSGRRETCEIRLSPNSGQPLDASVETSLLQRPETGERTYLCAVTDISERKRSEEALNQSRERYRTVADHSFDWECWLGSTGELLYISPSCERVSGYTAREFEEDPDLLERVFHEEDRAEWRRRVAGTEDLPQGQDLRIVSKSGRIRWVTPAGTRIDGPQGENLGLRFTLRDVTQRKLMEQQLERAMLRDPLTGLANRTLCLDRIGQAMARSRRRNSLFALIFLDIDRFKVLNDSLGHVRGDAVLAEVGRRIQHCVRSLDTVSRFSGDEFIVLMEEQNSHRETIRVIRRIQNVLHLPINAGQRDVSLTACYGVVLGPVDYGGPEDILQNATIAMNAAKENGRDRIKVFSARMLDRAVERMALESDLELGLQTRQLFLEFQPIFGLEDGRLNGFEALVRWRHPRQGLLPPSRFVPIAEESGAILQLGQWVLEEACRIMVEWRQRFPGWGDLKLSVNLSARQLAQANLVERVASVLESTGLPPHVLNLEVTETAVMGNAEVAVDKLGRLKALGVGVAIDDFGTGYSSMSYLQRFPLDILKIDLSFVSCMDVSQESLEIVRMIINLAHTLKIGVVAEGVEKEVQEKLLSTLGCEFGQGFLFSPPLDEAAVEKKLAENEFERRG